MTNSLLSSFPRLLLLEYPVAPLATACAFLGNRHNPTIKQYFRIITFVWFLYFSREQRLSSEEDAACLCYGTEPTKQGEKNGLK
eukprot:scaffold36446_cov176-Amphora_coffeaeformis.AAC.2